MKVWIDQDLCTGDGLCEEIAPDVFFGHDDGLFYVWDQEKLGPDGEPLLKMTQTAPVPDGMENATIEAAEECPGECIFIEGD
jgi:ferredoxin